MSGRPLTICKWGKGEPNGEHGVAFMYKLNSNGEQSVFGSVTRLRQGNAYICEIANGKFLFVFFFVFSFVCLFVFLTERYHKRFSVVITFFANVCDTHDRIYIKSSDSPG